MRKETGPRSSDKNEDLEVHKSMHDEAASLDRVVEWVRREWGLTADQEAMWWELCTNPWGKPGTMLDLRTARALERRGMAHFVTRKRGAPNVFAAIPTRYIAFRLMPSKREADSCIVCAGREAPKKSRP